MTPAAPAVPTRPPSSSTPSATSSPPTGRASWPRSPAFGYGAAEPFSILDDPAGLAADLAAAGLAVCSVHAMPAGEQAAAVIAAARTLGTDTVIVPYLPPERFADAASVRELAAELNGMAARLAGDGLRLGYHNHDFELSSMIGGRPALEVLAGSLDDGVLLEVDTYWAAVGGQDVPALLGRLGDRVRYLHVKDGPVTKDDPMTAVGAGPDAGGRDPGRGPGRGMARGRAGPVRDRHDDRGGRQPGLAGRPWPGPAGDPAAGSRDDRARPPVGVAVVGCGTISDEYLRNLTSFPDLRVLCCADLDLERAKAQAAKYGVPGAGSTRQAVEHPEVEIVVNLTVPAAHAEVAQAALAAGKHVWVEKPLALDTAAGPDAAGRGRAGRAPDRLRPGHRAGRRAADRAAADRCGRHRRAADRAGPDAGPGAGPLAPRPRVPVPARRRARCSTWGRTT